MQSGGTINNNAGMTFSGVGSGLNVTGTTTNNSAGSICFDGGSSSTLTGNVNNSGIFETGFSGGNNKVTVSGTFTNNAGAALLLSATGDAVSLNILNNAGKLTMLAGTTLTITGGGNGITDVAAGSEYDIGGTFQVKNGATLSNAYAKVSTVEGIIKIQNGQTSTVTPNGGTLAVSGSGQFNVGRASNVATGSNVTLSGNATIASGGVFGVDGGSKLTLTGNVNNSGQFETGFSGGSNTVNVSGTFTNNAGATLLMNASGDVLTVPSLSNAGKLTMVAGTTLTITGGGNGITDVAAGSEYDIGGTFQVKNGATLSNAYAKVSTVEGIIKIQNGQTSTVTPNGGTLAVSGSGQFNVGRASNVATGSNVTLSGNATIASGGVFGVDGGSKLTLTGNVNNSGQFETGFSGGSNTVN